MHRAINIKHRIVRRVDIGKAPLATFDTVDLGDEDIKTISKEQTHTNASTAKTSQPSVKLIQPGVFVADGRLKTETIGGNNSKKSLSQGGGEEKESKDVDRAKQKLSGGGEAEQVGGDTNQSGAVSTEPQPSESKKSEPKEGSSEKTDSAVNEGEYADKDAPKTSAVPTLNRQGTIGRVSIPIKKQDSDSSSSSSGSCKDNTFTFNSSRPSVGHLEGTDAYADNQDFGEDKDGRDSLLPDNIDPSQILSPSKRKAYERRIERLKVTTSPIARPRSTTPISVVTLDEYATISSPEPSPASPSVPQDKLKITLPCDEFTTKPKTPKLQSAKRRDSEDSCFEFTEEILFSRTKSALVVDEDGQLPLSPRRVLIPPTLTPTTSPKLSAAPRLSAGASHEETSTGPPKLVYIQHNETAQKYFGDTVDEPEEENWAHFSDAFVTNDDQTVDSEVSNGASLTCDNGESKPRVTVWPTEDTDTETQFNIEVTTEVLPLESAESQKNIAPTLETEVSKPLDDSFSEPVIPSHFDQREGVTQLNTSNNKYDFDTFVASSKLSAGLSTDFFVPPTKPTELPDLVVGPDFEPEEEILTVEIREDESGCEKHIEIEIKSSGSSGNISPADSESSHQLAKLYPGNSSFIPKVQSDSALFTHLDLESDSALVPPSGITKTQSDYTSLSFQADQQLIPGSLISQTDKAPTSQPSYTFTDTPGKPNVGNGKSLHGTDPLYPHSADPQSAINGHSCLIPQGAQHQQQQEQQGQEQQLNLNPSLPPPFPPVITNPFAEGFEPPDSDPFNLGLPRISTNPFLTEPSNVPSDLIDFSSSFDNPPT